MDVHAIRSDFPALDNYIWFQNGGVSITPKPVAESHLGYMNELLQRGPMHIIYPEEEDPRREQTMQCLADFFSVSPRELALMRGVSEAFQTVLRGLRWNPGDELIISSDEEAALLLPVLHLRDQHGIQITKLPVMLSPTDQLLWLEEHISEKTRLLALSHVTTDLGVRLSVSKLCAHAREKGVHTFVDLAHSAGLFPIAISDLNCDFAGLLSYKWMYAPYASGLLYVDSQKLNTLDVTYAGGRSEQWLNFEQDGYELKDTAGRFQYGPWSWPLVHAWADATRYLEKIGINDIWKRTTNLTDQLKASLTNIEGVTLLTPLCAEQSASLVSFSVEGYTGEQLAEILLKQWNMIVKPLPHTREGLRVSVPFFSLDTEIDLLIEAIRNLASCQPTDLPDLK